MTPNYCLHLFVIPYYGISDTCSKPATQETAELCASRGLHVHLGSQSSINLVEKDHEEKFHQFLSAFFIMKKAFI